MAVPKSTRAEQAPAAATSIRIAENLELDTRAATQKFGIIARSEAGKTYLAGKLVEGLHAIGSQVIVFDPVGNWWSLTLAANGTDPGLPFVVFGGRRGHLPLTANSGRRIARLVIERNLNAVLDLTGLRKRRQPGRGGEPESEFQRFVADFEEEALEASQHDPRPRMAVYDEAHKILPQVLKDGGSRMLDAGEDLVRTGRNYGWGCVLMSQRPQSINKEVLSQVECFFVGQLTEAPARARLSEWIVEKHADVRRGIDELAQLRRGEFYCWSPQWLRRFDKIRVLPKWTFDGSRTPEVGQLAAGGVPARSSISEAELAALRSALETSEPAGGRVQAAAPAELQREVTKRREAEARALGAEERVRAFEDGLLKLQRQVESLLGSATSGSMTVLSSTVSSESESAVGRKNSEARRPERVGKAKPARVDENTDAALKTPVSETGPVDKCQRAIMTVLIQQRKPLSTTRLGMMAVYAPTSGGFKNALSKLRKRGWIEGRGDVEATSTGHAEFIAQFGEVPRLPRGAKLFDYWLQHRRVDKCGRAVLTALREHGGGPMALEQLARSTDPPYAASSGGFKNTLSKLRTLGLVAGRGEVQLAPDLR